MLITFEITVKIEPPIVIFRNIEENWNNGSFEHLSEVLWNTLHKKKPKYSLKQNFIFNFIIFIRWEAKRCSWHRGIKHFQQKKSVLGDKTFFDGDIEVKLWWRGEFGRKKEWDDFFQIGRYSQELQVRLSTLDGKNQARVIFMITDNLEGLTILKQWKYTEWKII